MPLVEAAAQNSRKSWWLPSVLGICVTVVLVATTFVFRIKADDIWWHLKTGQLILQLWHLPDENLFSFTAPHHSWLPHEWLSEVVFYLFYKYLGYRGLVALGIALNALACALVYKLTARYSSSPYLSAVITLLAALMMLGNFSLRAYLFGNLFFICTLHAMEEPSAGGRLRPAIIFALFTTWANFHGSFLIGLALIILHMMAAATERWFALRRHRQALAQGGQPAPGLASAWSAARPYARDFVVALLACMVTPNHVFGLVFPLTYLRKAFSPQLNFLTNISEWQPAGFSTPLGRMITFYLMFCGFALVGSGKSPRPVHVGLLAAFAVFAYSSIRNIPLLGIAATPVLARHLPDTLKRTWTTMVHGQATKRLLEKIHLASVEFDRRSRAVLLPAIASLLLLIVFLLPPSSRLSYSALTGIDRLAALSPAFYPQGLLEQLAGLKRRRRIFHYFNWGGAMIWRLYPRQRVFIDQRNDCYPLGVFRDYFAVHRLESDWRAVLDRWRIDLLAYPPGSRLANRLLEDREWKLLYRDSQALLFERRQPLKAEAAGGAQPPR